MTTLGIFLDDLPDKQKIKIGAERGHAYFYVGTAGDFRSNIEKYSEKGERFYAEYKADSMEDYHKLKDRAPSKPRGFSEAYGKKTVDDVVRSIISEAVCGQLTLEGKRAAGFLANFGRYADNLDKAKKRADYATKLLNRFMRYGDRIVREYREAYMAVELEPTKIIILTGYECGGYWYSEEARGKDPFVIVSATGTNTREDDEED